MLFQVACNQFLVIKKTWPNMLILLLGVVVNICLNYTLIPRIGIEGAAIATLMGYVVSDIIVVIVLCCMKLMVISRRFLGVTGLLVIYTIIWRCFWREDVLKSTLAAVLVSIIYVLAYRKDLLLLVKAKNK
jgi:O-antigen/teichoic acid export membrane protein